MVPEELYQVRLASDGVNACETLFNSPSEVTRGRRRSFTGVICHGTEMDSP